QDYFADGMTEALITDLGKISALRVVSSTSVMQYKKAPKPLGEIAKELNLDAVVEGSVLRSGSHVQINARLVQARTDTQMWSQNYEREMQDVLRLQAEVARTIAAQIRTKVTSEEQEQLAGARPVDAAALEAYLHGVYLSSGTTAQQGKAKEYFEQAIELDPAYAPAYAGLAQYYWGTTEL